MVCDGNFLLHNLERLREVRNAAPLMRIIVAPDARSSSYDSHKPPIAKTALRRIESSIIFFRLWVNCLAIAAGMVSRAMTRIIPTTLINITTVSAIRHRKMRYRCPVGIPTTIPRTPHQRKQPRKFHRDSYRKRGWK